MATQLHQTQSQDKLMLAKNVGVVLQSQIAEGKYTPNNKWINSHPDKMDAKLIYFNGFFEFFCQSFVFLSMAS